jgi:membrane protein implicated in regulation of membrane protease activity
MLTIYWICFIAGGFLVALAALTGLDGIDFGTDWDLDVELRTPSNAQTSQGPPGEGRSRRWWLPVFSLKFWTFGSCFFGLTGLLFSRFYPLLPPLAIAALALGVGLSLGTAMAWIVSSLPARQVDSLIRTQDLVGLMGTVEIPFDASCKGKVRVGVKGVVVDFPAFTTEESKGFVKGEPVLIVGVENNKVWVVSETTLQHE